MPVSPYPLTEYVSRHFLVCQVNKYLTVTHCSFPGIYIGKESTCNAGNLGLIPGSKISPRESEWQPTPVFLPGEFHGQRSLASYGPWGRKEDSCHLFITTDAKHLFVCLRPICNHFSVKSLFPSSLPIFLVGFECKLLDILQ